MKEPDQRWAQWIFYILIPLGIFVGLGSIILSISDESFGGIIFGLGIIIIPCYFGYINLVEGFEGPHFFIALVALGVIASVIDYFDSYAVIGLWSGGTIIFWGGLLGMIIYWDRITLIWQIIGVVLVIMLIVDYYLVGDRR